MFQVKHKLGGINPSSTSRNRPQLITNPCPRIILQAIQPVPVNLPSQNYVKFAAEVYKVVTVL